MLLAFYDNQMLAQKITNKKILWTTDWSSDGKYIAVGGNLDTLKIYTATNLLLYKSIPIKNTITCVKWHPFKNILLVATQLSEDKVCIINFDTNKTIELNEISAEGARAIDWNYTGDFLAVADNEGQISIFDSDGKFVRTITSENKKSLTSLDWHTKKNIFITVGDKIRMYDFDGTILKTIIHRQEDVLLLCVAWHNSGSFFVTGDYGDNQNGYKPLLQFWNEKGGLLKSIDVSKGEYRNLSWNSKGTKLATASDALRIWGKDGNLISNGKSTDYLWGISWDKKGNRIITSSKEQKIVIWDSTAKKIVSKDL